MNINSAAITTAKILLGITDTTQDTMLLTLGNIVEGDALAYTHNTNILFETNILGRMIQVAYQTKGNEGITAQSFGGVSEAYTTSYPDSIQQALRGFTKLKAI